MEELVMITPIVIIKLTWFNLTWLRNWSGKCVQKGFFMINVTNTKREYKKLQPKGKSKKKKKTLGHITLFIDHYPRNG